jgi:predicted metal-dependent peptidase
MPPTEFMQTAGIDYKGNFYFAPDYIDSLSDTDLNFVVAHETLHLALAHLLRKENRDKLLWNVAIDYATNNMLEEQGFHYSKQGILRSDKFKGLSAEEIYDRIKKEVDKLPKITFDVHIYGSKSDGGGKSNGDGKTYGNGKPDFKKEIDNGEDEMEVSEKEMNELSSGWKERVITAYDIAKSMGRIPAGLQRLVEDLLDSRMDWRSILRRFITNEYPFDYSWSRPSKRSCSTGIYMPYVLKENIDIVVAIDTSGSVGSEEFKNFMSEIVGIAKTTNVMRMTLITCDCAIHEVHEITNDYDFGELKVSGYGGTDFRPVFKWIDENKPNTKLLVYFTDGMGEYPKEETVKTIWVYPKEMGKYTNPPFGESIVMGEEE